MSKKGSEDNVRNSKEVNSKYVTWAVINPNDRSDDYRRKNYESK